MDKNLISMNEPTLSRQHCSIYFSSRRSKWMIKDNEAKFGTGMIKSSVLVKYDTTEILKGRTYFRIMKKKKPKSSFFSQFSFCSLESA